MKSALPIFVGIAAAFGLGYALTRHEKAKAAASNGPITAGSLAMKGDFVEAPVSSLGNLGLPLPPGVGYVYLIAASTTADTVSGGISGYRLLSDPASAIQLPSPIGPVTIPRSAITSVSRNGSPIA